jgi:DNA-binding transcriptional LysR family regulator
MSGVELRDLEYFLACVEEKSVTRAARKVHVSQPALSHALARLENEVGQRLLDRGPRAALRATDAGRLLESRARAALSQVRAFRDDVAALRGLAAGTLRIASIQTLNATLLPPPLARFARAHPGVEVSVTTMPTGEVAEAVRSGRVDVGLVAGMPPSALERSSGLAAALLYEEKFVVVVRAGDDLAKRRRVRLAELAERPMLVAPAGTYTHDVVMDACARAGFVPRVVLTLDSGEALRETVRCGLGLTLLPESYVPTYDHGLRGVEVAAPTPTRKVLLLEGPTAGRAARAFVAELRRTSKRDERR